MVSAFFLFSCGPSAEEKMAAMRCIQDEITVEDSIRQSLKSTFDAPFPKRNRNLARILGDTLQIKGRCSYLTFKILSTRKSNLIVNIETGDTLFNGTVCKYRDLYYFNEQIDDSSFRIFALRITDSLIYGLQNYFQYSQIDNLIANHPQLVKFIDGGLIKLHSDKKELHKLYTAILKDTKPFEIIRSTSFAPSNDLDEESVQIASDDFEVLSNVYPNPAKDILNVELHWQNASTRYSLSDFNGKVVLEGEFRELSNKIDISHLPNGIYVLTVLSSERQPETLKIIKANNFSSI